MAYVLKLLTLVASDEPTMFDNTYVIQYDPNFVPAGGEYDGGSLLVDPDVSKARRFASPSEALEYWRQSHGIRPDGEPNRPLTAYNAEVIKV